MATSSDSLKQEIKDLRETVEALADDVSSTGRSVTGRLGERAARKARRLRAGARTAADEIATRGRHSAEAVENTVRNRPFRSVLVAFGAGLVVSHLFHRR